MKTSRRIILALLLMLICGFVFPVKASTWSSVETSTWTISSINYNSYNPSLELDNNGLPHIGYQDLENFDLKYAVWQGNSWTTTTIDSKDYAGYSPTLDLDTNNQPHISYTSREPITSTSADLTTKEHLKYAVKEGNTWSVTKVDNSLSCSSLKLDSNDQPHISYCNSCLKYVVWNDSSWIISAADSTDGVGEYSSLALDSKDRPHICYFDGTNIVYFNINPINHTAEIDYTKGILKYATLTETGWEIMTVDQVGIGMDINLVLDSHDQPHVSYSDKTTHNFRYAVLENGSWNITPIDSASEVTSSSLALDSNDRPHIAYSDITNDTLKYARFTGTNWEIMTVDSGFADSSLVLDQNDRPHIAYCANGYLKYAVLESVEVTSSPPLREPLNLKATIGNGNVTLSWSPPSLNAGQPISNYKVYRGTASGSESFLAIAGNATTYTDVTVDNDLDYYYRVSAVNSEGEGAKSNQATVATLNPPSIPTFPKNYILVLIILLILILTSIAIIAKKAKSRKINNLK